jgi:hypothetical protein
VGEEKPLNFGSITLLSISATWVSSLLAMAQPVLPSLTEFRQKEKLKIENVQMK